MYDIFARPPVDPWDAARVDLTARALLSAVEADIVGENPGDAAAFARLGQLLARRIVSRDALIVARARRALGEYDDVTERQDLLRMVLGELTTEVRDLAERWAGEEAQR